MYAYVRVMFLSWEAWMSHFCHRSVQRSTFVASLGVWGGIWGVGVLCGLGAAAAMAGWGDGSGLPAGVLLLAGLAAAGAVLAGLPRRFLHRRRAVVWQEPGW